MVSDTKECREVFWQWADGNNHPLMPYSPRDEGMWRGGYQARAEHDKAELVKVREALKSAQVCIDNLYQHGNWDNGVYDPTGSISEGQVRTTKYVNEEMLSITNALDILNNMLGEGK